MYWISIVSNSLIKKFIYLNVFSKFLIIVTFVVNILKIVKHDPRT